MSTIRPRLLDLFCGAGGCSVGYHRAGFDVVGIDIKPQPCYPFPFILGDALDILAHMLTGECFLASDDNWYGLVDFVALAASPPCQRYTVGRKIHASGARHPALVGPTRALLLATGKPWVIENVVGAPLQNPITLCGTMFGLRVFRHRLFESSFSLLALAHPPHDGNTGSHDGFSTLARGRNGYICVVGHNFRRVEGARAMGIDWMQTRDKLAQATPPAFTEYVGRQLLAHIEAVRP